MTMLDIDQSQWDSCRGRTAFHIRHNLVDEPLLAREPIAALASRLPEKSLEHNVGDLPAILPEDKRPRVDRSPQEIARHFDEWGCWLVLWNIEQDPTYQQLMDKCLDEVAPDVVKADGEMLHRRGFIFLSAPDSVTPCHADPEHNFLLQISGWKEITVGGFPDAESQSREMARQYRGGHRYLPFPPDRPETFRLEPGDGVYVPPWAPHLVKNGDGPSVSLSITWKTPTTELYDLVFATNAQLRRLKLHPSLPGHHARSDQAKAFAARAVRGIQRRIRK